MSCQICVEVCPFDAIKMDTEFELSTDDRFGGLLWDQATAGEIQRVLPRDPSHRSSGDGSQLAADKAKAEAKAKAAATQRQLPCRRTALREQGIDPQTGFRSSAAGAG